LIELESIWKTYGMGAATVHALQAVDLRIADGEYVAIVGQSGSGKSTLMHILGCLDVATSGRYLLDGDNVQDLDDAALAAIRNRRIGFVFQQFHLLARLSARRNVELPLAYAGVRSGAERRERARSALESVGLGNRLDHRPGELSGGQQQRVAIARALVTEPAIILADEPTGNLAGDQSAEILALLDDLWATGRTVVLITHDPGVAAHARRLVRVQDGHVISEGVSR
jgi:putative ABC transport system ATP-binding protein